jgi:hypothetical protein
MNFIKFAGLTALIAGSVLVGCSSDDTTADPGTAGAAGTGDAGAAGAAGAAAGAGGSAAGAGGSAAGAGGSAAGAAGGDGTGTGPAAGLLCKSSGKNAFQTYGSAFGAVRDGIIGNVAAELGKGGTPGFGPSFNSVAADPAKLAALEANLGDFLVFVYGGPNNYKGQSMTDAHKDLAITQAQYDYFLTNDVVKALTDKGVPQKDIDTCFAPPLVDKAFVATIVTKLSRGAGGRIMVTWKRVLVGLAAGSGLLVGLIGFAHTAPGRPLKPLLFAANKAMGAQPDKKAGGACPLGYSKDTPPQEIETRRQQSVAEYKGASPAQARPALAFSLGKTTRTEVESWASSGKITCTSSQGPLRLTCAHVPGSALTAGFGGLDADEIYLQFNPSQQLVSVGTVRSTHDAEAAIRADSTIADELSRQLGAPTIVRGERSQAYLTGGLLRQVRTEFRFSDYFATTSLTSVGQGRLVISERYELLAG